jgi:hypothetical protein
MFRDTADRVRAPFQVAIPKVDSLFPSSFEPAASTAVLL